MALLYWSYRSLCGRSSPVIGSKGWLRSRVWSCTSLQPWRPPSSFPSAWGQTPQSPVCPQADGKELWQSSSPDSQQRLLCHLNMRQQARIVAENYNVSRRQWNTSPIYSMLPHTLFVDPIICNLRKNKTKQNSNCSWCNVMLFTISHQRQIRIYSL